MSDDGPAPPQQAFLINLAEALHRFGSSSHRTEEALARVAETLGERAEFLVTPTSITAAFGAGANSRTYLKRMDGGEINLAKLHDLHAIFRRVRAGEITAAEGTESIETLTERPPRYGILVTLLAFGVASTSVALFFDGGWLEAAASGGLGVVVGGLGLFLGRWPRWGLVFPAIAGVVAGGLAATAGSLITDLNAFIPTLAGLIFLLPGLTLTIAVNELAHRNLVSGTARLAGALITFLQLAFGVALGQGLAGLALTAGTASPPTPPSVGVVVGSMLATAMALTVLFKAHPRHAWVILPTIAVAFFGARIGSELLGPSLGALVAAWGVGVLGTLLARWRDLPSAIPILPGLLLLVPGSIGFRSLAALLDEDVLSGLRAGTSMMVIAFSLVIGLLFANLTVAPREYR